MERLGFHEITVDDPDHFPFIRGDVMVMQPHRGGEQAGHVAGYDGRYWISDFVQRDFWAGPDYRNQKPRPSYAVYRYWQNRHSGIVRNQHDGRRSGQ